MPVTDKGQHYRYTGPTPPTTEEEVMGIRAISRLMGLPRIDITWVLKDSVGFCTCSRSLRIEELTLEMFTPWMESPAMRFTYDGYELLP